MARDTARLRGGAKDFTGVVGSGAVIHFLAALVQVPQHRVEIDAGGIDQGFFGYFEMRRHGQQLAANGVPILESNCPASASA